MEKSPTTTTRWRGYILSTWNCDSIISRHVPGGSRDYLGVGT